MPQKEKAQAARRWFGSCQLAPKALACILKLCTLFENPKILVERARWYFIPKLDKAVEGRVKKRWLWKRRYGSSWSQKSKIKTKSWDCTRDLDSYTHFICTVQYCTYIAAIAATHCCSESPLSLQGKNPLWWIPPRLSSLSLDVVAWRRLSLVGKI